MATISVCMIVKDEEENLAKCLDCLTDIADEIIIVDTGSTDDTVAIAQRYADEVHHFEWVDDFAAARNYSLSKASGDYIYVADADEMIDAENQRRFAQLKEALLPEVEVVEMAYINRHDFVTTENFEGEYRPKLFRRLRRFQYADPIHEVLRTDPVVFRSNVAVYHYPSGDHSARDLGIFATHVRAGTRFSARLEMMYARELLLVGSEEDFENAHPYFERVRLDGAASAERMRRAACVLAKHAALTADGDTLLKYAAPELVGQPPAEICCSMGDYFLAEDNVQSAADWYTAALSGATPELVATAVGRWPLEGLAACFDKAGDTETAARYRTQAENWTPGMPPDMQGMDG